MKTKKPIKATKRGRPKTGQPLRTARVHCSLTPEDAEWWSEYAAECGFVSRAQMITAILERLRISNSPIGALRMWAQIQHKHENFNRKQGKSLPFQMDFNALKLRPFPPLPEDAPFDKEQANAALVEFQHETTAKG